MRRLLPALLAAGAFASAQPPTAAGPQHEVLARALRNFRWPEGLSPEALAAALPPRKCGHIRIHPAPEGTDPGIEHTPPETFSSRMPVLPGLPACPPRAR